MTMDQQQLLTAAASAEKNGQYREADTLLEQAYAIDPTHGQVLKAGALLARRLGNHAKAADWFHQLYVVNPSPQVHFEWAVSLMNGGRLQEAHQEISHLIAEHPKNSMYVNLLGVICKIMGKFPEAITSFKKAMALDATNYSPLINLGNVYAQLENHTQAIEYFTKATKIDPKNGEYMRLLANSYNMIGNHQKALSLLQGALLRAPKNMMIRFNIVTVYYSMSNYEKARIENEKALSLFPGEAMFLRLKGILLKKDGKLQEAKAVFEQILQANPRDGNTLYDLAKMYHNSFSDRKRANELYAQALQYNPNDVTIALEYADCLLNSRYGVEAEHIEQSYQIAKKVLTTVQGNIQTVAATQNILMRCVDYDYTSPELHASLFTWTPRISAGQIHNRLGRVETMQDRLALLDIHRKWGEEVERNAALHPIEKAPAILTRQKIRVGFMSSDLRNHPVTYFVLPLMEGYDKKRFEFFCYSFHPNPPDAIQQLITEQVDSFQNYPAMSDYEVAQKIADDSPDILFELGGSTYMNKLEACAYRPAPIQVSWLGYPNSCGLSTIDYILVDPYIKPEQDDLLIERPFMMPESWVTLSNKIGFTDIPIEKTTAEERRGYVTFGTMNNPYKYTPKQFEVWSRILQQVPGSHFMLVRPEGAVPSFRNNVLRQFAKHGIAAERVDFMPVRGKHMPCYNEIDIALDCFPHTGGTTTCETLWMGVPAVTLVGPAFFERLSYSNLSNAGLGDLCAKTLDEYVSIAVGLAGDKERRKMLKHELRQMIRNHPLGQAERFVRSFEATIEKTLSEHKAKAA